MSNNYHNIMSNEYLNINNNEMEEHNKKLFDYVFSTSYTVKNNKNIFKNERFSNNYKIDYLYQKYEYDCESFLINNIYL